MKCGSDSFSLSNYLSPNMHHLNTKTDQVGRKDERLSLAKLVMFVCR